MDPAPLPEPVFVERDIDQITAEMVDQFEQETGRVLRPAQVERLLIDLMSYRENLLRIAMQEAALQNLLAFARFPMLDFLGEIVGAERLPASPAQATIEFTLTAVQPETVTVPAGTRVQTTDGAVIFTTDEALDIPAGQLTGAVTATAATVGEIGNGYVPGTVSVLLDPVAFVGSAENTTTTDGGADTENDERFRDRIRAAPNQFSVAGPAAAYRFHALSVNPSIVDVSVTSPVAGTVRVYVLADTGPASAPLLQDVADALSADDVRPLTDTVETAAPTEVAFQIDATVRLLKGVGSATTLAAVEAAAEAYADELRAVLGADIVPSQVVAALSVEGVYEVTLSLPAFNELAESEWANCTSITITEGAPADG